MMVTIIITAVPRGGLAMYALSFRSGVARTMHKMPHITLYRAGIQRKQVPEPVPMSHNAADAADNHHDGNGLNFAGQRRSTRQVIFV